MAMGGFRARVSWLKESPACAAGRFLGDTGRARRRAHFDYFPRCRAHLIALISRRCNIAMGAITRARMRSRATYMQQRRDATIGRYYCFAERPAPTYAVDT